MSNNNNPLVLIGKNYVYLVTDKGLTEIKNIQDLKDRISDTKVKIIVGHDASHYHIINFLPEELADKKMVQEELQKKVPSNLNKVTWNHKVIETTKKKQEFWTFSLEDKLINPFLKTLIDSNLIIEEISSFPHIVAKSISKQSKPTLLIFTKNKIKFLAFIWENRVVTYDLSELTDLRENILNFINLINEKYKVEIKDIVSVSDRDLDSLKLKIEKKNLDFSNLTITPLITNYEYKEEVVEKEKTDEEKKKDEDKKEKENSNDTKEKNNLPRLLLLLGLSLLIMRLVFLPKIFSNKEPVVQEETTQVIVTPTPSPSPSPAFYPNLYTIQVLNGTKVGGLATEVSDLLEDNGYLDVEAGNADEDYVVTEIITGEDEELKKHLLEIIESEFIISTDTSSTILTENLDAIVILGNKK